MGLMVDCAILAEVERLATEHPLAGATTNPSILLAAHEKGQRASDIEVLRGLLAMVPGPVFMQPMAGDAIALFAAAMRYSEVEPSRVVVKLPPSAIGLTTARALRQQSARLSFTAVTTLVQAWLTIQVNAEWIIPYLGRMRKAGLDPRKRIGDMVKIAEMANPSPRVLVASVKSALDVEDALLAGAHDITASPEVIRTLLSDEISTQAYAQFTTDWAKLRQKP
jgi:TalC/MipB family fructose-6-phosphate aldolase